MLKTPAGTHARITHLGTSLVTLVAFPSSRKALVGRATPQPTSSSMWISNMSRNMRSLGFRSLLSLRILHNRYLGLIRGVDRKIVLPPPPCYYTVPVGSKFPVLSSRLRTR
jgi:hypothetical protein